MSHEKAVLSAYGVVPVRLTPISSGHIHQTILVETQAQRLVLQRMHQVFGREVHEDVARVTQRLHSFGLDTFSLLSPRVCPLGMELGPYWVGDASGATYRLMTFIEGVPPETVSTSVCVEAATLLARFHTAMAGWEYEFRHVRTGIHDTLAHRQALRDALSRHADHAYQGRAHSVAQELFDLLEILGPLPALPLRVVHGDPKLTNFLFDAQGHAVSLIDLDTVGRMALPLELGDAFRSWCNTDKEDGAHCTFDCARFEAALSAYWEVAQDFVTPEEIRAVPDAIVRIALELSARFCKDVLEERYFSWDRARFARAADHHLQRARSQLTLSRSALSQRPLLSAATERIVGG